MQFTCMFRHVAKNLKRHAQRELFTKRTHEIPTLEERIFILGRSTDPRTLPTEACMHMGQQMCTDQQMSTRMEKYKADS